MGDRLGTLGAVVILPLHGTFTLRAALFFCFPLQTSGQLAMQNWCVFLGWEDSELWLSTKTLGTSTKGKPLHRPGIEPGPPAWQASILPLNQRC
jgi:hypothetical protein